MSCRPAHYSWIAIWPLAWGLFLGTCLFLQTEADASPAFFLQEPEEAPPVDDTEVPAEGSPARVSVMDGVFTSQQASRGEQKFHQACGQCHRRQEFSSSVFRRNWAGQTMGDLFELIVATMPEGQPGSLRSEEYGEIVAFILQSNDYPPGGEDLPTDLVQLENIRIVEAPR